ncbi:MAG: hypothetical protein RJA10_1835 [Pseudomonadota bacterium]|jgi:hypothetical protein
MQPIQPFQGWFLGITLGIALVMALRFGAIRTVMFLGIMVVIQNLSGCGGGTADGLVGVEQTGVVCPDDPATFVGPVQAECMLPAGSAG